AEGPRELAARQLERRRRRPAAALDDVGAVAVVHALVELVQARPEAERAQPLAAVLQDFASLRAVARGVGDLLGGLAALERRVYLLRHDLLEDVVVRRGEAELLVRLERALEEGPLQLPRLGDLLGAFLHLVANAERTFGRLLVELVPL